MNIQQKIQEQIDTHPVLLYMKGTPDAPQCGFSHKVVQILHRCKVPFHSIDVLDDPEIRQGIKEFSQWPTIPQLYVNGEFVGGCDIVSELFDQNQLQPLLDKTKQA
ncbi:MAG: monothiol glutaredoxin, Grx4 family [Coxiella sp. RIFCSPHIGHO2_12_FULL_44_14]|nr:MAG: monothiol glutaredoxin, Grx4 family [Coxiella sp. RIFCSPHIGHO2_12_FULL_44_14]